MKFSKFLMFTLICLVLILSACGKDEVNEVEASPSDEINYEAIELGDKEFMNEKNISLTAREVQYDVANNLDKEFFISGVLELCDYYNYGFTNEKNFACTKITPIEGDSWYLYLHRESLDNFYQMLLSNDIIVRVSGIIPSNVYESGQSNMAMIKFIRAYNPNESE